MRRRKISGKYLSVSAPPSYESSSVAVHDFATAIKNFADEYLRGAATVDIIGESSGFAKVSVGSTAYLLRTLLEYAEEDETLVIKISLTGEMTISVSPRSLPDDEIVARIIAIANAAGFSVARDCYTLLFSAAIDGAEIVKIYALSKDDIFNTLFEVLFL